MPGINQLTNVNLRELLNADANRQKQIQESVQGKDFGETIADFINTVNDKSKEANQMAQDVVQGKSQNLHEAMAALEESGLSFKLMIEIRNKLLESYKEVERMQI